MARYKVLDSETQTHIKYKRKASPWHPDNYIVMNGWYNQGDKENSWEYFSSKGKNFLKIEEDITLLVVFNGKFDLLWQWDNPDLIAFFKRGGRVWDVQYVEYLLEGAQQSAHMLSLNEVAPKYGGKVKIDEVKILWDQGVQTSDINKDLLIDYLAGTIQEGRRGGDIRNTELAFLGQMKRVAALKMGPAIQSRMDGLCATIEMEWNGLKIDLAEAKKQLIELTKEKAETFDKLQGFIPELPEGLEFNWGSRTHKSCLIFGGTVKYNKQAPYIDEATGELARYKATAKWPLFDGEPVNPEGLTILADGTYMYLNGKKQDVYVSGKQKGAAKFKNVPVPGEVKVKYQEYYFRFEGFTAAPPEWATKSKDAAGLPLYSTASENIMLLASKGVPFTDALSRYEALDKEIGTYFISKDDKGNLSGMLTCVDSETHLVHHKLNNVSTVTTRLSSSDPNLQNIPRGDKSNIKRIFTSRFKDGKMIEADYSQLEVVVQGVLSADRQLCEDLRNKVDFHCKRIAIQSKYGKTYEEVVELCTNEDGPEYKIWKAIRTKTKIFSFQRAYGAGASLIALSTGMTVDEVKELIAAEEATYPGVKLFNEEVEKAVQASAVPFQDPMSDFQKTYRRGYWTAPTGCIYSFRSWEAPDFMKERGYTDTFKPTELKNYPVQGTGGEIVQGICGRLWRHFVSNDNYGGKAVLCNTVHDCIWVDSSKEVSEQVAKDMKRIMERVDDWFAQFNVKITVPFPVEVEMGPNMLDLKHAF